MNARRFHVEGFEGSSTSRYPGANSPNVAAKYRVIGDALSIAEAATIHVGIPWLPPTAPVRERQEKFEAPLEDFIQLSVTEVPTSTLESYCDDLEQLPPDKPSGELLGLAELSFLEHHSLAFLFLGAAFVCSLVSLNFATGTLAIGISAACLFSGVAGFIGASLTSETYRRASFYTVIAKEVARRGGRAGGQTIGIYTPAPLSE